MSLFLRQQRPLIPRPLRRPVKRQIYLTQERINAIESIQRAFSPVEDFLEKTCVAIYCQHFGIIEE